MVDAPAARVTEPFPRWSFFLDPVGRDSMIAQVGSGGRLIFLRNGLAS